MKNSAKITFWLNEAKKNVANETPIYMRVRVNTQHFTKSTGINIPKGDWDSKQGKVKGSSPKSSTYNDFLEGIRLKIIQISTQLNIQGAPYNMRMIKKIMEGDEVKNITLMMVFDDHLFSMQKLVGKQYTKSTMLRDWIPRYLKTTSPMMILSWNPLSDGGPTPACFSPIGSNIMSTR